MWSSLTACVPASMSLYAFLKEPFKSSLELHLRHVLVALSQFPFGRNWCWSSSVISIFLRRQRIPPHWIRWSVDLTVNNFKAGLGWCFQEVLITIICGVQSFIFLLSNLSLFLFEFNRFHISPLLAHRTSHSLSANFLKIRQVPF